MSRTCRRSELTIEKVADLISSDIRKDLHIHTCYSDGALRPEEVVSRWEDDGYRIIAITDHDGIEGSVIGLRYAEDRNIIVIPGIEFDSEDESGKDLHVLGYGMDYDNYELRQALRDIILRRARRNDAMLAALSNLGYSITLDDIGTVNEGRFVGKPTFAQILTRKGYVSNQSEAFNTIFREPEIRSISKETYSTSRIIELIHASGGLAVMAHPMEQRHRGESYVEFLPRLMDILDRMRILGIDGMECYHPSADEVQAETLREYADRYGLLVTRGSDFHSDEQRRDFARYHRP